MAVLGDFFTYHFSLEASCHLSTEFSVFFWIIFGRVFRVTDLVQLRFR